METILINKFKLGSFTHRGEYYFNSNKEAEQKASELGWTEYIIQIVTIQI